MRAKPLNYDRIVELHDKGLKGAEIARHIGATKGAVSKALKKLGREVTKCAVAEAAAHHEKKNAAVEHLLFLCDRAKSELEWIDTEIKPVKTADYRAWQDQKLKFAAEMRKLISAISEIGYKLFQVEEVSEILKIIDEEIGCESIECQKRIRERVERRRAIRFPSIPN